jgi:hypothetical protein
MTTWASTISELRLAASKWVFGVSALMSAGLTKKDDGYTGTFLPATKVPASRAAASMSAPLNPSSRGDIFRHRVVYDLFSKGRMQLSRGAQVDGTAKHRGQLLRHPCHRIVASPPYPAINPLTARS